MTIPKFEMKNRVIPIVIAESLIPKNIDYCYTYENDKQKTCPFWEFISEDNAYCSYLKMSDCDSEHGLSLLWDQVKECGIGISEIEYLYEMEFDDE